MEPRAPVCDGGQHVADFWCAAKCPRAGTRGEVEGRVAGNLVATCFTGPVSSTHPLDSAGLKPNLDRRALAGLQRERRSIEMPGQGARHLPSNNVLRLVDPAPVVERIAVSSQLSHNLMQLLGNYRSDTHFGKGWQRSPEPRVGAVGCLHRNPRSCPPAGRVFGHCRTALQSPGFGVFLARSVVLWYTTQLRDRVLC